MKRKFGCILGIVLLGALFAKSGLWRSGIGRAINPHGPAGCQLHSEILGVEDLTIHPQSGVVFFSSHDRRAKDRGDLYSLDLRDPNAAPVLLTGDFPSPFRPHGIGLFVTGPNEGRLFVVNHRGPWTIGQYGSNAPDDAIELFDYQAGHLTHQKTLRPQGIYSANDIEPIGLESYYVTNDHGYSSPLGKTFEDFLRLDGSFVSLCEGEHCSVQASGLAHANGVKASPDGHWLYVACTTGRTLEIYERQAGGLLRAARSVFMDSGVDNIELDTQGRLWIGSHPKLLDFVLHAKDAHRRSPSQVLLVTPKGDAEPSIAEVYLNDGDPLSGSSVAAVYGDKLLIGAVFEGFLICPNPAQASDAPVKP